jgi:NO-binding membrane sensor protein with MHYT domain
MGTVVTSNYHVGYVFISYCISVLGGFVALTAASRIRRPDGGISLVNTIAAGMALGGIGVWSMHFMGMLALQLNVGSSYSLVETLTSLVAAIIASSLALGFVAREPENTGRLLVAGFLLGIGVVVMHYLGMYGMKIGGYIQWDYGVVAVSVVIAIITATTALWLALNTASTLMRLAAGFLMGGAVCAMHYTGMFAANFICTAADPSAAPQGFGYISSAQLPNLVGFGALTMAVLLVVHQFAQESVSASEELKPFKATWH